MKEIVTLGLTEGRHDLPPVDGFIFPKEVDPTDLDYINNTVREKTYGVCGYQASTTCRHEPKFL